jgi:hypothetical protein
VPAEDVATELSLRMLRLGDLHYLRFPRRIRPNLMLVNNGKVVETSKYIIDRRVLFLNEVLMLVLENKLVSFPSFQIQVNLA